MSEEIIKLDDIDRVGMEIFRKNNQNFYKSYPSEIMSRIFIAANKDNGITEIKDEYYMKSGAIPNKRVYYIYSDQLHELGKEKIFDIVRFNDRECMWIYSKNTIDKIGEDPIMYTNIIYKNLLNLLKPNNILTSDSFITVENRILVDVLSIRLLYFLYDAYGVIDLNDIKEKYSNKLELTVYTKESIIKFINHIIDNFNNNKYFIDKIYLDSYMILVERNRVDQ